MNAIFHRVSIRKYQNKPVEEEKIEKMLRAAMAAPSACNQQPWEYYVVTNKEMIEKLSKVSPYSGCAKDAPLVFVPCYRSGLIAPSYADIDMSASVENLLLQADSLGLGAVWMGISPQEERMKDVKEVLGIREDLSAFALVPCGYPAEERPQEDRYDIERIHFVR
ncbi:MAG: nitroreductase family protein [Eubacteriales bacterium]|nr:nitroreductase family protein [Eubacteriales bacterium]